MNNQDKNTIRTIAQLLQRYDFSKINKNTKAIETSKNSLDRVQNELTTFVTTTTNSLTDLQNQVDGNITTWFYSGLPTLSNTPANGWPTDTDKNNHLGDLYYDTTTGYAYRFASNNTTYEWLKITDTDVTQALAKANAAQDTADSKRRTFVTTPTTPYDVGDIWVGGSTSDIKRCIVSRSSGNYNSSDWDIASKYTDDSYAQNVAAVLDSFKENVETNYATNSSLTSSINNINASVNEVSTKITNTENSFNEKLNDYATNTKVDEIKSSVSANITANSASINVINETLTNGVSKVKTDKGFMFNDDGMTIDETNSKTKSNIDTNGLKVLDKTGSANTELLFAGYDETLRESIVRAMNLYIYKYFTLDDDWRIEVGSDDTWGKLLEFYYIGDD